MRLRTPYFYYWYRLRLSYLVALFVFAFIYLDRFLYGILIGTLYFLLSARQRGTMQHASGSQKISLFLTAFRVV